MTVVLVHGNPETADVRDPLVDALGRAGEPAGGGGDAAGGEPPVRLSPPGFGAAVPVGWRATPLSYRHWLITELERLGTPVHLVGHDWGGVCVLGVAMERPDLLRSWCSDSIGLLDPEYVWHALARSWQTPGTGEQAAEHLIGGTTAERAAYLTSIGLGDDVAGALAPGCARVSATAILELYRSARQPVMTDLGQRLADAAERPGLALLAPGDPATGTEEMRRRCAARAGATVEVLPGGGHWWMLEEPRAAAEALLRFWRSVA